MCENPMSDKTQKIHSGTLSYRDSGVDVDAGDRLVEQIRPLAEKTWRPGCLGSIGGFGGLFELPLDRYRNRVHDLSDPYLVGCDSLRLIA